MNINKHYLQLQDSYLFSRIAQKVKEHQAENPDKNIIRLGIGDVTQPLAPAVVAAMQQAATDMGNAETFRGYGEEQGYAFVRESVCKYYKTKKVSLDTSEIFIGDGAKSDLANILDIFAVENTVLIPDPVYPVYVDTNIMAGRKVVYIQGNQENGFLPLPDANTQADIIYLCSPNNPTGAVYTQAQLKLWVDYALKQNAIILFDSAYEAFIQDKNIPTSIYQIEGAKACAIEFCSLSKTAGFTGTRCGYTIVPHALQREGVSLNSLWLRRQTTKFNGVSYIVQKGAEAVFSAEGLRQSKTYIAQYMQNARLISDTLKDLNIWHTGGTNAPYLWLKCPHNMTSWEFFDALLLQAGVVGTPGAGFGSGGEGYFRFTAFGSLKNTTEAMERLRRMLA